MAERIATEAKSYWRLETAAEYLDVSIKTVRRAVADGTLTAYRVGRTQMIRLDPDEVAHMLNPIPTVKSA